ncbi:MAG TPA: sugar phosphate nucleotidyltransferase [Opitutaceae bacterium]|nr:sugar phosphate nucleotidyltransferase [Opitutaceae bacterium]
MNRTLLILAAGMGSRYGGLKQIDPVGPNGEAVLDYSVYDAVRSGFNRVVFIIRRDFEALFREKVGHRFEKHVRVDYVFQERDHLPRGFTSPATREKPWGTGHAVWCAHDAIQEPFAVINADDFYGADTFRQLDSFLATLGADTSPLPCAMAGFRLKATLSEFGTVSRGVCQADSNGFLQSIVEQTAIETTEQGPQQRNADGSVLRFTGEEIVSMNCWGFHPGIFPHLEQQLIDFLKAHGQELKAEFYLPAAVGTLVANKIATVKILPTQSTWFGVTYREDRPRVTAALAELIKSGEYPGALWAH